jgi:taurine dioxygenase
VTTVVDTGTDRFPSYTVGSHGIEVAPLTATIGAELRRVSLAEASRDDALFAELKALLLQHKVLFLRDRIYKDLDSAPEHYENAFHCDATWREVPPMGSVLRCVEGPPVGGDTIWVDMVQAYRRLPEHVKAQIEGLKARHSIEASFGAAMPEEQRHALHERFPDAEHPVVRTHPETGEKALFVNAFTTHFTNWHTPQNVRFGFDYSPGGSELLNYLIRQAFVPEYQVRWRWTANSFAIWDNRCTQHYAVQDYWPAVRRMERAGIVGTPTF